MVTPVPGGVGPCTVACLMLNTLKAAVLQTQAAVVNKSNLETAVLQTEAAIEQTNAAVEQTNAAVEQTNATVEQTNAAVEHTNAAVEQTKAALQNIKDIRDVYMNALYTDQKHHFLLKQDLKLDYTLFLSRKWGGGRDLNHRKGCWDRIKNKIVGTCNMHRIYTSLR